ncbi:NAD-glutamate dehydrogenase [Desulfuromonas versatilis]|nr:NAD-glutamate dehydrogenase domain-containing protein [Desulfuromonas versatilis]
MKILFEPPGNLISHEDLAKKASEVFALLEGETGGERFACLKSLGEILLACTPFSYLAPPSARQLADWVKEFLLFIESRRDEVAVRLVPFGDKGHTLLLTNCPDVPYLVDSLQAYLARQQVRFQVLSHPIIRVRRTKGELTRLAGLDGEGSKESFIVIELEGVGEEHYAGIEQGVVEIFQSALVVARDHKELSRRLKEMVKLPEMAPFGDFMRWLEADNFLVFSYRRLQVSKARGRGCSVQEVDGSSLGIPSDPAKLDCREQRGLEEFEPFFRQRLLRDSDVVAEEIERTSPVHRDDRLVYLGFREKISAGRWDEHQFLGLFPQKASDELTTAIASLRKRIEKALETLGIPKNCHDYRKTMAILNTFPKLELFFMEAEELAQTVRSFTLLYRQGAVKVVAARSLAVRGLTLLVIMPRAFYSTEYSSRIETYLRRFFKSPSAKSKIIHISTDYLSLHVSVLPGQDEIHLDLDRLERGLTNITRPWILRLRKLLDRAHGDLEGGRLWRKYSQSFSREYRTLVHPRFAIRDIDGIEKVFESGEELFDLWGPFQEQGEYFRLQYYSPQKSFLNELMPLLENLNLWVIDEVDFSISLEGKEIYIKSFAIRPAPEVKRRLYAMRAKLLEALGALRRGEAENDFLNRLLPLTGLSWRDIDVFRGYRNYYFQLGSPYTKRRVAFALINNPQAAKLLFRYFEARFRLDPALADPMQREEQALSPIRQQLIEALAAVKDVNEDNILRTLFNLIDSTVRTNFFLRRERPDYFFSFKISAIGIIDMPAPRPLYEIYVHSADMEGIHLRGGKVARGGLRWSDRPDDFRTEILGLMKTQMTKNALIVPVGSKGGFVVKTPFTTREQGAALSKAAYQTLIRGLLDLTDNRVGEGIVRPTGIVTYDEEDPYLVVAADKGTAHLPDTANAISAEYGFWLDDAFASGGSRGYDHKVLGITARGAWECVKRHFRELDRDIQSQPFTVVGIGDMSGDVFGNGMLLSRQIRLLAAFDHRHIFLDPDPDPEASFRERQRLFDLPRSSWDDYDRKLISEGGGVFPRDAKDIPLSPQVRQWLGIRHQSLDAQGLIRLLLGAEVDLLWNGGIGTYVKASTEKHEDVGDRANDGLRIDAGQLRAKVVGEGGNLGMTQKGRIEFALGGGRLNTDAVDNSAGVDCSDHEVNLKIFMRYLKENKVVEERQERDRLLLEVTEEVCRAVLDNNYGQSLCLSLDQARCAANVEPFLDLSDRLENVGMMDRRGEFLPTGKEIRFRKKQGYTRPELAILMAYSKMQLFQELLESDLPDQPGVQEYLLGYFPGPIRQRFEKLLGEHPLAREITATVITNTIVNQAGSAMLNRLSRQAGTSLIDAAAAYLSFDQVLQGAALRQGLFALDNKIPSRQQYQVLLRLEETLGHLCSWAMAQEMAVRPDPELVKDYAAKVQAFEKKLGGILPEADWQNCKDNAAELEEAGLPASLARQAAALPYLEDFLPVVSLMQQTGADLHSVARIYGEVRQLLAIRDCLRDAEAVQTRDRWDRMAYQAIRDGFQNAGYRLTLAVLQNAEGNPERYFARRRQQLKFYHKLREGLRGVTPVNYNPFTVLINALEGMLP